MVPAIIGMAKLASMRFAGQDVMPTYRALAERLLLDDTNVAPLIDVAILDQLLGSPERALTIQSAALRAQRLFRLASNCPTERLRVLGFAMAGPVSANSPVEFLIEDSDVTLYMLYVVPGLPLPPIPEHDLAIVLAAESEAAHAVFDELEPLLQCWARPVLNRPQHVPLLGRERLCRLIGSIGCVEIPATVRVDAETLARIGFGAISCAAALGDGDFPIIVRPIDSHGGHGLDRLESHSDVAPYLARNPVEEYFISRFVDYRSPDGLFRKYRIAVIDGVPYPSHLAISGHWMIHFLNAGMEVSADKRSEEERFMAEFRSDFGARHGAAFAAIAERSGLEYFGVDCGETQDGKLLVFEADTSLIVHNMDSPEEFPYKAPHMRALFAAFQRMLYAKAGVACPEAA